MLRARLIAILLASLPGAWIVPATASDFTWTAGADTLTPLLNNQDADAGVVQSGANLDLQTALEEVWQRWRGPDLDHLAPLPNAKLDTSFPHLNGDVYWTNGIWQDPAGKRYAVIHVEYDYLTPKKNFYWKRRIGLATSTDQGANWHYEGDIITTNPARPGAPPPATDFQDFGCGDTYLCVDRRNNYFYVYYMTAWVYQPTGWRTRQIMSVARCPISAKMAPGQWTKWSGGTWTQLGLGGAEDAVFQGTYPTPTDSGTDSAVVHFNTYLNAFVAIGHDTGGAAWIRTATSLASQNWQPADYTFPQRLYWYNWPIDPVTHDRYEIGQTFRLYSAQANVSNVGTKYFTLTLSKNNNAAPSANLIQPEEGTQKLTPGPVTLIATASDSDGQVSKVEFFANQQKIGEVTAAPYVFIWKAVPVGNYRLSVRATDNTGAATESAGTDISVTALTFNLWKQNHGLLTSTPSTAPGPSGRPILVDYALNLDYEPLPEPKVDTSQLSLTYTKARPDVSYSVERSVDLTNWTTQGVNQGTSSTTSAPVLVTATTPIIGSKTFLHVRLSSP